MSEPKFREAIELAKLQVMISDELTHTYTFIGIGFSIMLGFLAIASSVFSLSTLPGMIVAGMAAIVGAYIVTVTFVDWYQFYQVEIPRYFNKIYNQQKIDLRYKKPNPLRLKLHRQPSVQTV